MIKILKSGLGFLFGLTLALLLTLIVGENPFHILKIILNSSFGSSYDLGLTLFYTTSLIFTGLAVTTAFKGGLFNIGAEGQLSIAALSMVLFALTFKSLQAPWSYIGIIAIGLLSGAFWGFIPAILKAYRHSHEVIVTMMLNFIAAGISSYFIINVIPNTESQNPESAIISEQFRSTSFDFIHQLVPESPLNLFIIIAFILSVILFFFFRNTILGYQIQAVGENMEAAERAGISSRKMIILSLIISSTLASGAAMNEIIGNSGQYKLGFSPELGFVGIAVALMANNHPLGVILSAFLMGALHKGASDLDLETNTITKDFSKILQALIIFGVGLQYYIQKIQSKNKKH